MDNGGCKDDVCLRCAEMKKSMKPHQERVIAEQAELHERHAKLLEFGLSDKFYELPKEEQARLKRQSRIMGEYSLVLGERIAAFNDNNDNNAIHTTTPR